MYVREDLRGPPVHSPTFSQAFSPRIDTAMSDEDLFGSGSDSDPEETVPAKSDATAPTPAVEEAPQTETRQTGEPEAIAGDDNDDDSEGDLFGSGSDSVDSDEDEVSVPRDKKTESAKKVTADGPVTSESGKIDTLYLPPRNLELDGVDISIFKTSKLFGVRFKEFDPDTFDEEEERLWNTDAQGNIKHLNVVRWRYKRNADNTYALDEKGEKIVESNARIVKWSDGSQTMQIGKEVLLLDEKILEEGKHRVFRQIQTIPQEGEDPADVENVLESVGQSIKSRYSTRVSSLQSKSHAQLKQMHAAKTSQKNSKYIRKHVEQGDAEANQLKRERALQEAIRAEERKKRGANRSITSRVNKSGMSAYDLEHSDDEGRVDKNYGEDSYSDDPDESSEDEFDADALARKKAEQVRTAKAREERMGARRDTRTTSSSQKDQLLETSSKKRKAAEDSVDEEEEEEDESAPQPVVKKAKISKQMIDDDDDD